MSLNLRSKTPDDRQRRSPHLYHPPPPQSYHHHIPHPTYMPYPHFDHHRYEHDPHHSPYHPPPPPPHQFSIPTTQSHPQHRDPYHPYPVPGSAPVNIVHTDDAATKLSDRVRRRCFNCCTTDTSTWRRSNLSPGKVLCNKCGLFERTHSRPRPEQFPHKRGPLASSTLRARTPPSAQLPPISPPAPNSYYIHHPHQQALQQDARREATNTPPQSYAPAPPNGSSQPSNPSLPALQSWSNTPVGPPSTAGTDSVNSGSPHMPPPRKATSADNSQSQSRQASASPHLRAQNDSNAREQQQQQQQQQQQAPQQAQQGQQSQQNGENVG